MTLSDFEGFFCIIVHIITAVGAGQSTPWNASNEHALHGIYRVTTREKEVFQVCSLHCLHLHRRSLVILYC